MKRGEPQQLRYTARHGQLTAVHAIRDIYDALVELLTNADDSYHSLFVDGRALSDGGPILVEVEPHRRDRSVVRVKDRAAGFEDLISKIANVGERTSRRGDRGFMARGLKDCAALGSVLIETIVDGRIHRAELTSNFELIPWEPSRRGGDLATADDRRRLGISRGNGTVVELRLESRVRIPQLETLRRELPWHYALRDITRTGSSSSVLLRYGDASAEAITSVDPDGQVVYDREHAVPGYPEHRFRFTLTKATSPIEDPGDGRFRRSGILVKGARAIHGCSFLSGDLERDPSSDHYFGRIECAGIDAIAEDWDGRRARGEQHTDENPMFILDPNRREGLNADHPFVKALFQLPRQVLKEQFERDRQEREQQRHAVEAAETTDRLRRLAREASRFMREKLDDLGSVAPGDTVDDRLFNRIGIGISPTFTQIPLGTSKSFLVKVDNRKLDLPSGTEITVDLQGAYGALVMVGEPGTLESDPIDPQLLRASFVVRGERLSRRVRIECQVDGLEPVHADAQVIPAMREDVDVPGGLAFHRKAYTVRHGGRRTLVLRTTSSRSSQSPPRAFVQSAGVAMIRSISSFEPVDGTHLYEATVVVEGRQPSGRTKVIAEAHGRRAYCELLVANRDEEGVALRFRLVDYDLGTNHRAVWDRREPNTLLITTQHESIGRYLGSSAGGYPGQHGAPFRVLLAELIADNVCRRIVEQHARALPNRFDSDKLYLLHNRLMKEFTPIAHRIQLSDPMPDTA